MDNNYISDDDKIKKSIKSWLISIVAVIFVTITVIFSLIVIYFTYFFIGQPELDGAEAKKNYINFTDKLGNDYRLVSYKPWGYFGQKTDGAVIVLKLDKKKTDDQINKDTIRALEAAGCRRDVYDRSLVDYEDGGPYYKDGSVYSEQHNKFFALWPTKELMSCSIYEIIADNDIEIHGLYTDKNPSGSKSKQVSDKTLYSRITIRFNGR